MSFLKGLGLLLELKHLSLRSEKKRYRKARKQLFLCPVALHTAPNKFMSIFQRALILRAV
jgi:hypothetical protein